MLNMATVSMRENKDALLSNDVVSDAIIACNTVQ